MWRQLEWYIMCDPVPHACPPAPHSSAEPGSHRTPTVLWIPTRPYPTYPISSHATRRLVFCISQSSTRYMEILWGWVASAIPLLPFSKVVPLSILFLNVNPFDLSCLHPGHWTSGFHNFAAQLLQSWTIFAKHLQKNPWQSESAAWPHFQSFTLIYMSACVCVCVQLSVDPAISYMTFYSAQLTTTIPSKKCPRDAQAAIDAASHNAPATPVCDASPWHGAPMRWWEVASVELSILQVRMVSERFREQSIYIWYLGSSSILVG